MEITNIIIRKPVSEERRLKGVLMLCRFNYEFNRLSDLKKKIDTSSDEHLKLIVKYADDCSKTLGFKNCYEMCRFISIYGAEAI